MWNREEAFWVIEKLEPQMAALGAHVALGGSVAYCGTSEKDLDLILYPHTAVVEGPFDWFPVQMKLKEFFHAPTINDCEGVSQVRDGKKVSWLTTPKGKRVDFFFLQ